ncbi:MAG: beta-propeller domain-containing protein [Clostridia bacterium]|nr:beta-propeller domain-containing protein [Clostridia bacterium]
MKKIFALILSVTLLLTFTSTALTSAKKTPAKNPPKKTVKPKAPAVKPLPTVGSFSKLKALLAEGEKFRGQNSIAIDEKGIAFDREALSAVAEKSAAPAAGYSDTNIQVQGVDEADVVKTDGQYIYQVNNGKVVIAQAYPANSMKVITALKYDENSFHPLELYVDKKHLVVIGNSYYNLPAKKEAAPAEKNAIIRPGPPYPLHVNTVKTIIYDISDKTNIKKLRETELEGNYISSRKIGSALYLTANKYIDYYYILKQNQEPLTPLYRDSAGKGLPRRLNYQDIRYFPNSIEPNYLMIAGLNLDRLDQQMKVSAYLGSGQNIYASQKNLYVAVTQYETPVNKPLANTIAPAIIVRPPQSNTTLYKFALDQGQVTYTAKGQVPGTILNQFSMDEDRGRFRIATTKGDIWRNDEHTSKNNVYILDETLKITGKLEDIAPGEKIYSVRFMGNRGYMVTFKTVDPLFVIDLKDPKAPKILGALKIPGYSDYLHPYDENHIIGFGKDTVELGPKEGNPGQPVAYYQGLKIALFDVTDVTNPKEKFKENIGDRGTDSALLRNHKALLFSKEKNLLAFPVTVMEVKNKNQSLPDSLNYGEFTFQGAYVYHIDLVKGFDLKGKITHLTAEDQQKAGYNWYDSNKNVERVLYIGDTLYTLSKAVIKAHDLSSLQEKNSLSITQ